MNGKIASQEGECQYPNSANTRTNQSNSPHPRLAEHEMSAILTMRTSCGSMSFAQPKLAGKTGPKRRPMTARAVPFTGTEWTNQLMSCMDRAMHKQPKMKYLLW